MITGVEVVDLSKRRAGTLPCTDLASPAHHLINYNNRINNLRSQITLLQVRGRLVISVTTIFLWNHKKKK